jgi:hypothetical protein
MINTSKKFKNLQMSPPTTSRQEEVKDTSTTASMANHPSLMIPRPSSEQTHLWNSRNESNRRNNSSTENKHWYYPRRSLSIPTCDRRRSNEREYLNNADSAESLLRSPSNARRTVSIVQRSGSKQVRAILSEISDLCSKDLESTTTTTTTTTTTIYTSLQILQQHVVDSYYQVIVRKYDGIQTLQKVMNVYSTNEQMVTLCKNVLKLLEQQHDTSEKKMRNDNTMILVASPKTVVTSCTMVESPIQPVPYYF